MTLLVEDLLLLLLDDESGKAVLDGGGLDTVLGGAVLLELALAGRVEVHQGDRFLAPEKVLVSHPSPLGDDVLDEALAKVAEKPRGPQDLVGRLGKGLRVRLLGRAEKRGLVRKESDKVWGLFPRDRWPVEDSRHEDQLRARLSDILVVGTTPDERTGALVALLSAVDKAHTVPSGLDGGGRRAVKRRAKEVASGAWAATAVRRSIEATQAAVTTAILAATITSTSSS